MMKKNVLVFALLISCIVGLSACSNTAGASLLVNPSAEGASALLQPNIGFILYSGENETDRMTTEDMAALKTLATAAHWNIVSGSIEIDNEPMMLIKGANHYDAISSWDGNQSVLISNRRDGIEPYVDWDFKLPPVQRDNLSIQGHNYHFELTPEGVCNIYAQKDVKRDLASALAKSSDSLSFSNLSYLKSEFDGTTLRIAFIVYGKESGHDSKLIYVTINMQDDEITWSPLISIPEKYDHGLLSSDSYSVTFVENRLYFSGWDTIAYLALNANRVAGLETITDSLDTIFPNAQRNRSNIAQDTYPVGSSKEVTICFMPYYDENDSHLVYYAVRGHQLLGVMSLNLLNTGTTITTYNSTLELLQTVDISHLELKNIPLKFQSNSYQ